MDPAQPGRPVFGGGRGGRELSIHPSAQGFARAADAYERGRPDYPAAAVEWLAAQLELTESATVVDLAAGTGKLTRLLAPRAGTVLAVEPIAEMAAKLRDVLPRVEVVDGTAEAMPLESACADAVTVAQAFHWFAGERALAEIHRVLRPGGRLGLVWNRRDLTNPLQGALEKLIRIHRYDTPAERSAVAGGWRRAFETTELFTPFVERDFPHSQTVDADLLVDRVGSTSFVAALPDPARSDFLEKVRGLVGPGERAVLPYNTGVHVCRAL